jgi:DNA-binding response OmpR family regulator
MVSAVLLVKDAPDLAGVIGHELEAAGCRVIRAGDGETVLRLYAQHQPDLVILTGSQGSASIAAVLTVPVLMLTARSEETVESTAGTGTCFTLHLPRA